MSATNTFRNLPSDKQERIMEAALDEFAAKGYARASLNSIVASLGIAKGSLFQYFKDKTGLFSQVFDFAVDRAKGHLRQVRETTRGQSVATRLEMSLVAGVELIQRHPRLFQLYLRIIFEGEVPHKSRLLASIRLFSREYLLELLRDGVESGEISPELDLEMAAFMADAVLERFLVAHVVQPLDPGLGIHQASPQQARLLARRLMKVLAAGLESRA